MRNKKMDNLNRFKQRRIEIGVKDSDQNEDDSFLGSDDLSDLRFSSQDNLLDSSQDGDNQCDVKWDYTSPQTMRQLRKMRGKYCAADVKKIIAKFPDLPVQSTESLSKNICFMLPPKNAAATLEKNKRAKAKQRELKSLRQQQRRKKVAEDMILFLHEEKKKEENKAAEKLKNSSESTMEELCDPVNEKDGDDKLEDDWDDAWSDDDLFMDNSFLIAATQNPEKFIGAKIDKTSAITTKSGFKNEISSKPVSTSKSNQYCEISTSSIQTFSSNSNTFSKSSGSAAPSSVSRGGNSHSSRSNMNNNNSYKFVAVSKKSNFNSVNRLGAGSISSMSTNNKPVSNCKNPSISSRPLGKNFAAVSKCNSKTSTSSSTSSFSSNNNQPPSLKSPFRKSLSFDAANNSTKNVPVIAKTYPKTVTSVSKSGKSFSSNIQHFSKSVSSTSQKQGSVEQDSFDSSISDELLLQATLSEDFEVGFCSGSQPLSKTYMKNVSHQPKMSSSPSLQPKFVTSRSGFQCRGKQTNGMGGIGSLLLSPVRPAKEDSKAISALKSPIQSSRKGLAGAPSTVPAHVVAFKHKSPQGLSSSTPVKSLRVQDDSLEKAFEDSFMNDEALFESQILPMLELAESQIKKTPSCDSRVAKPASHTILHSPVKCSSVANPARHIIHSPMKCSPEEIEVKRQTAIKKRSLRSSQTKHRKS